MANPPEGLFRVLWPALALVFLYQTAAGVEYLPSWELVYLVAGQTDPVNLVMAALFIPAFGVLLAHAILNLIRAGASEDSPLTDMVRGVAECAAPLAVAAWVATFTFVFLWGGGTEDFESQATRFSNWFLFWFFLLAAPAITAPKKGGQPGPQKQKPSPPQPTLTWFAALAGTGGYADYAGPKGETVYAEERKGRGGVLAAGVFATFLMAAFASVLAYAALTSPIAAGQEKYESSLRTMVYILAGLCYVGAAYAFLLLVGSAYAKTPEVRAECVILPLPHLNGLTLFTAILPKASIVIRKDDIESAALTEKDTVFTLRLKDGKTLVLRWGLDPDQAQKTLDAIEKIRTKSEAQTPT
jgi:hypothetical protein